MILIFKLKKKRKCEKHKKQINLKTKIQNKIKKKQFFVKTKILKLPVL